MKKILEDIFHIGLGLTRVTKEQVEKVFNELKKKGELEEKDREPFVKKAFETIEKLGKEFTEKVTDTINPSKKKIEELEKKIDELVKELKKAKSQS